MVGLHRVEDEVRSRTTVVDVAEDMQLVDGQAVDHVADGDDEVVGAPRGDDGVDDGAHVGGLVHILGVLVQQFLDDVAELRRQALAHLRPGVFARHLAAHLHQVVDGDMIPVVDVFFLLLHELKFLAGVIDQRAEFFFLRLPDLVAEDFVHLPLDVAGSVFQYVAEGLELSVDVGQEMLGAFGQIEDGLQVDDLGTGFRDGGEGVRQQLQVAHVVFYGLCFRHISFSIW